MKFVVAAGILARRLPVASAKAILIHTTPQDHTLYVEGVSLASIPGKNDESIEKHEADGKYCDPFSRDPDVGILSCEHGSFCKLSKDSLMSGRCTSAIQEGGRHTLRTRNAFSRDGRSGILKNARKSVTMAASEGTLECDATPGSPDTGILSCRDGQHCVPHTSSSVGGVCVESASSRRRLYQLAGDPGLCDPNSEGYMYFDCDCSGYDVVTGTGNIACTVFEKYCVGPLYQGCDDVCATKTLSYNFLNFATPGYRFCDEIVTPYAQKICFEEIFGLDVCTLTFNDQPCTSCTIVPDHGYDFISFDCTNVGGIKGKTIYDLLMLPIIETCYIPFTCEICDGPLVNPDTVVSYSDYDLPCSVFETHLDKTICDAAISELAPKCCAIPRLAPARQTPSGASTLPFAKSILSFVGLAAVGACALVLN